MRVLARAPPLGGNGYGWDDWTILLCLAFLVPMNVLLNKSACMPLVEGADADMLLVLKVGLAKEIWALRPEQINGILFVSS